jgi:cysteinyl-tRNA synthetase
MAMRYLGPQFEIHTGGIDNVFPHHEDEIAQSSAITGVIPARHWVHGEFLLMDGRKMAKSAGNFQRVTELVDRGLDPLAFRYLVLTSRYSRKLEYSERSLEAAAAALGSLRTGLRALGAPPSVGPWVQPPVLQAGVAGDRPAGVAAGVAGHGTIEPGGYQITDRAGAEAAPLTPAGRALHDRFVSAIDDDLDLPVALALMREILRAPISTDERRWLILDADAVLGLGLDGVWAADDVVPVAVAQIVDAREAARGVRDWALADSLRAELSDLGWEVVDGADGPTVRRPG